MHNNLSFRFCCRNQEEPIGVVRIDPATVFLGIDEVGGLHVNGDAAHAVFQKHIHIPLRAAAIADIEIVRDVVALPDHGKARGRVLVC